MSGGKAPIPQAVTQPVAGRVLAFVPHADDDVLGIGGTLCLHAEAGDEVKIVVAYDGLAGDPEKRYDPEVLRMTRQDEARRGGAHLGLHDYVFWDQPEGHVPTAEQFEVAAKIAADLIRAYRPATIYAPHLGECHMDHHVLARVIRAAIPLSGFTGPAYGFEVWTPLLAEFVVDISAQIERKTAALKEHASQLEYNDFIHKALGLGAQRSLFLPKTSTYGEAFCELLDGDA